MSRVRLLSPALVVASCAPDRLGQVTSPTAPLVELAQAYGVMTEYVDWRGRPVQVSAETIEAVLAALGVDTADPERALRKQGARALAADAAADGGDRRGPADLGAGARDRRRPGRGVGRARGRQRAPAPTRSTTGSSPARSTGSRIGEATFAVPTDLPLGYHTLQGPQRRHEASAHLIVTPAWLGLPGAGGPTGRQWGFATQLYSVRSGGSWGLGDLADLTDLAVWSASELGADYVLVNPLHAAEPLAPLEPSPYLPSSRRFFNPIYLRVERIPEYAALPPHERDAVDQLVGPAAPVADSAGPRRPRRRLDREAGRAADRARRSTQRRSRARLRGVPPSARARRSPTSPPGTCSPRTTATTRGSGRPSYRRHDSPAVAAVRRASTRTGSTSSAGCSGCSTSSSSRRRPRRTSAGMRLGVMHDLAVGVHPGGADAWRLQDVYAQGVQVGAPPDPYNQLGQDWSQPPWRPDRLGRARLPAVPRPDRRGAPARRRGPGRPHHRPVPAVVDPDRPPGPRGHLRPLRPRGADRRPRARGAPRRRGRRRRGPRRRPARGPRLPARPRHPRHVDPVVRARRRRRPAARRALARVVPGLGHHPRPPAHRRLPGRRPGPAAAPARPARGRPRRRARPAAQGQVDAWLDEVRRRGLLRRADADDVVEALHRYLALTPARLLCVALTDAVGDRRTQNQPGTTDEYPNWRVPLAGPDGVPLPLEEVFTSRRARALAACVAVARSPSHQSHVSPGT